MILPFDTSFKLPKHLICFFNFADRIDYNFITPEAPATPEIYPI